MYCTSIQNIPYKLTKVRSCTQKVCTSIMDKQNWPQKHMFSLKALLRLNCEYANTSKSYFSSAT